MKLAISETKEIADNGKKFVFLLKNKKFPGLSAWKQFLNIATKKEKIALSVLSFLFLGSLIFLTADLYLKNTKIEPASGGAYIEAVIGRPRFINPIYSSSNDADRDLTQLIFSGLMEYDKEGNLAPDLAKSYSTEENGKVYVFYLKENIFWHDGKKFSANDVIFTIKTVQNSDFRSPLRTNWLGVEAEKIDDGAVRFSLKNPYPAFLENTTVKILPKHIWENIPPQNFPLADFNFEPIGTGPYRFKNFVRDNLGYIRSLTMDIFPKYFGKKPFIREITFQYYDDEESAISAVKSGEALGLSYLSPSNYESFDENSFSMHKLSLPRYFALFLNSKESSILADKNIRLALNYGTNKEEILEKNINSQGKTVDSPMLPDFFGFGAPSKPYKFDSETARNLLAKASFKDADQNGFLEKTVENKEGSPFKSNLQTGSQGTEVRELQKCLAKYPDIYPEGDITGVFGEKTKQAVIKFQEKYRDDILVPAGVTAGTGKVAKATRDKLNELCGTPAKQTVPLQFTLITVNQPQLIAVANTIKNQWEALGIKLDIKSFDISELQQNIIKPRAYQILLLGEVLGTIPDPFSFWHSSQKRDPGLNLANYENKEIDKLLEEARQILDPEARRQKYEKFQDIVISDAPAIFLYNPDYLYPVSKEIKNIEARKIADPSQRFAGVENWYIKTKRTWD